MATFNPREHKKLGRKVNGFNQVLWNNHARHIAYVGNIAKFTQNPVLLEQLIKTGQRIIAEASPYDKVWGIGLKEDDPRAQDPAQWQGTNWLGDVLMQVRKTLQLGWIL